MADITHPMSLSLRCCCVGPSLLSCCTATAAAAAAACFFAGLVVPGEDELGLGAFVADNFAAAPRKGGREEREGKKEGEREG